MKYPIKTQAVAHPQSFLFGLLVCAGLLLARPSMAAEKSGEAAHQGHPGHAQISEPSANFERKEAAYQVPDVAMLRQDGTKVSLARELNDGRPVILSFVYTSCTSICPVLSHVMSKVQEKLGKEAKTVRLVSIPIDPEQDTPARLQEYAKKFKAGPDWQFYTGTPQASIAAQKAFDAYRGDKMNHATLIFLRAAPGKPWVRLEGFVSPGAVIGEYRRLLGR